MQVVNIFTTALPNWAGRRISILGSGGSDLLNDSQGAPTWPGEKIKKKVEMKGHWNHLKYRERA